MKHITLKGTIFASDYNEESFKNVKIGMTESQVIKLIGRPLLKEESIMQDFGYISVWYYTRQRNDDSWWLVREVSFSVKSGEVCEKRSWIREP